MPSRRPNRPSRVFGLLWIMSIFVAGTLATSLGAGHVRAKTASPPANQAGQQPAAPVECGGLGSAGPLPEGDQSIGGLVTDTSATPLADVQVIVESPGQGRFWVFTNAEGRYVYEGLGNATYYVSFYDQTATYQSSFYDGATVSLNRDDATPVVLSGGGAAGIDAALPEEAFSVVSGMVTDSDGQAVGGAFVAIRGRYFGELASCALTEPDGSYELLDVRAGAHEGEATADGHPSTGPTDPNIVVPPDDTTVNFQFPPVYSLTGTILNGADEPAQSMSISVCPVGGDGPCGTGYTDEFGAFEAPGLVAGSYTVREEDVSSTGFYRTGYYGGDGTFVVSVDDAVAVAIPPAAPIELLAVESPRLQGIVTDSDTTPTWNVFLNFCVVSDGEICFDSVTGEDGIFSNGVPVAGTYVASVYEVTESHPTGWLAADGSVTRERADAGEFALGTIDVLGLEVTLADGGRIDTTLVSGGSPVPYASLEFCLDADICAAGGGTDDVGHFLSPALWPDTYYVRTTADFVSFTWYVEGVAGSTNFAAASPLGVAVGATEFITFRIPGAGTPTDPAGPGVPVTVAPDDGSGNTPVSLTFPEVSVGGTTSLTTSDTGDPVPSGFQVGLPAFYFDISTTAEYEIPILVCVTYDEPAYTSEANLRLFHFDGSWQDITTDDPALDTVNNVICGETDSLSPFVLAERTFAFTGIHGPKMPPTFNAIKAGDLIGLTFGLGGDFGLSIFSDGWPEVRQISCTTGESIGGVDATTASLKYSAKKDLYTLQISTAKAWKNTCRSISFELKDGTFASVWYRLKA